MKKITCYQTDVFEIPYMMDYLEERGFGPFNSDKWSRDKREKILIEKRRFSVFDKRRNNAKAGDCIEGSIPSYNIFPGQGEKRFVRTLESYMKTEIPSPELGKHQQFFRKVGLL